jgi:hypothetical protein
MIPPQTLLQARELRLAESRVRVPFLDWDKAVEWTRAGLVLEVCRRRGVRVRGHGTVHVPWRLKGTVTGRFGVEPVRISGDRLFNPMIIPTDDRWTVVPSAPGRSIVVLDFMAMDLCSLVSLLPGLYERLKGNFFSGIRISHGVIADHLNVEADVAKRELFVHAYGGRSPLAAEFDRHFPEISEARRSLDHGDMARVVQETSAIAFRAALSRALPLLLGDDVMPMFTVHDELVLDVGPDTDPAILKLCCELEDGATERIGVPYGVRCSSGSSYAEAKRKP